MGFFDRMYYGDPRKPDLRKEDMPEGRFKIFFTVLQIRFWKLIQLNLLYSIFWIPAFFVVYVNLMYLIQVQNTPNLANAIQGMGITMVLLLLPCFLIAGPATAGTTYVVRNWARDEHAWVWSDFKDAWKQNWKESLIIMLINGLALIVFYVNLSFYRVQAQQNVAFLILYYFILIAGLIYIMMNMFIFPMLVTYKLKVRQIFKNAFIFTMAELPRTFAIFVIAALIFGVAFYYSIPFIIPLFLVGFTFPMFITISYVNWVFDKYLNNRINNSPKEDEEE
jgi:uncharacterized membrane protein YesL